MKTENFIPKRYRSIRWHLFFTLAAIMFICQSITFIWLWFEIQEQIDAITNRTLSADSLQKILNHESFEMIIILLISVCVMMFVTLFLSYKAIKWIIRPLEKLDGDLKSRTAENLNPFELTSDMSEIKSITYGLNDLFARLNSTLVQERLFTADVAHELRTPLAGIRLHLELLEKNQHIDCQELIARIDRLVKTVEQLLMLSRASQKFSLGKYQEINVYYDIFLPLNNEFAELAEQKQQQVNWLIADKTLTFDGDETLILLLIRNLFENSYRYSGEGTDIDIAIYQQDQQIIIEVKDQSIGIDESKFEQLTQAFVRMDKKHKGIGLGLSIVSRIAKLHQAEFSISNRKDKMGTMARLVIAK